MDKNEEAKRRAKMSIGHNEKKGTYNRRYEAWAANMLRASKPKQWDEIEKINILNSSLKAMNLACTSVIQKIGQENILTLVDGNKLIKEYNYPQEFVIKGDSKSASIAAASILAKVSRDRYMERLHEEFPMYNWKKNAGYLTAEHLKAIDKFGTTKYHRLSFLKKHFEKQGV